MKTLSEKIAVMQAAERGEVIQISIGTSTGRRWESLTNPGWDWERCDYRVKPKGPREIWVNVYNGGGDGGITYRTQEAAQNCCGKNGKPAKFREVLEDDQ